MRSPIAPKPRGAPPTTPASTSAVSKLSLVSATLWTRLHICGAAFPAFKGSGDITSLSQADGYIEIAPDQSVVEEGAIVEVTLF